ncbi:ATP-dependent RNA helicase, putative [Theileria annulata]|uniref:ATP-dependent RNA helicase, putative n=1 Tax=Theileria annulata TaxID=5874 RepID=Q4UG97_THEAN|nr:ATP-dependent RNA helicase, putative [Theileria annulata]CAI73892.1 ATP-dependent RNA helicase, putative [Theileria annulata]|eukprot:XP_954569.1 ATP-dependent RNA helicase, putative [Theileria annulata]
MLDFLDKNPDNNPKVSQKLVNSDSKWKDLDIPGDLFSEGLISLEVLDNTQNHQGSKLNSIKSSSKPRNDKPPPDNDKISQEKEVTIDYEEVNKKTNGWTNLSEENYTIPQQILVNLYKNNFNSPTPIQRLTLVPSIIKKTHVLISSETGSGKTLCFVLPIVISLLSEKIDKKIESLVILPTRELAVQVKKIFFMILEGIDIRVLSIIGGISVQKQERLLKKDPSIVVATPGRLHDFVNDGKLRGLFQLRHLVLDEVDKFFEDNSYKEVQLIVKYVKRAKIQCFLSSATILNMKENLISLFKLLNISNPTVCICSKDNQLSIPYDQLSNKLLYKKLFTKSLTQVSIPENLTFKLIDSEDKYKVTQITILNTVLFPEVRLIGYLVDYLCNVESKKCIIFVNTITYVYRLESLLSLIFWKDVHEHRLKRKYCTTFDVNTKLDFVSGIHSRLKQKQRLNRLEKFSSNKKSILICTDVASRGLDIPNIDIVIHFHPPKDKSLFLHRSGRTARLKSDGVSVCFCSPNNRELWKKLFTEINKNIDKIDQIEEIPRDKFLSMFQLVALKLTIQIISIVHDDTGLKDLLQLAETIEKSEFQMSKEKSVQSWFQNAARKADIMLSDDETQEETKRQRSYKAMKSEKKKLLKVF